MTTTAVSSRTLIVGGLALLMSVISCALAAAQPVWEWRNPLPTGCGLINVTWTGSQAVAVGDGGRVLTSPDGISWSLGSVGSGDGLNAVTWTGSELIAVGACVNCTAPNLAAIYTSPNGLRWTRQNPGPAGALFKVTWTGDQVVAVGDEGTILTSPDGLHWTSRTSGVSNHLEGVTWTGEGLMAVGSEGTVLTSSDGVSWSVQTGDSGHYLRSVTWTGTQFVAVGELVVTAPTRGVLLTSPDGVTWTLRVDHMTDRPLHSVIQTPTGLVVVGESGTQSGASTPAIIMTSPDGVTWATQPSGTNFVLASVVWTGARLVAVGWSGTLLSSEDSLTWTRRGSGPTDSYMAVTTTPAGFVAVGASGAIVTSSDGQTWMTQESGIEEDLLGLTSSPTMTIAVGRAGTILTSPDGVTWTAGSSGTQLDLMAVTWAGAELVAVGDGGVILASPDGIVWQERQSPTQYRLESVVWTGSQLVAVGGGSNDGVILTSSDGTNWTDRTPVGSCPLSGVTWGDGLLVAAGGSARGPNEPAGAIMTSRDGVTWSGPEWVNKADLRNVAWVGSEFVAVGNTGGILVSRDGIGWTVEAPAMGQGLFGITAGHGLLVATGTDGTILTRDSEVFWRQWVPVASHVNGHGGAQWRTDLALLNAGPTDGLVDLSYHGADGVLTLDDLQIAAGEHRVVDDVVGTMNGAGSGTLQIVSSVPVLVSSRTYTRNPDDSSCAPGATFGQAYTSYTSSEGLATGESAWLVQLAESEEFRTNIGIANVGAGTASAEVALFDGAGGAVGSYQQDLFAGEWQQVNRPFASAGAANLSSAWARVTVTDGTGVVAMASLLDNRTNDPTTFPMIRTTSAAGDVWLQVATHTPGLQGSLWRTDLGILNAGDEPVPVEVRFYASNEPVQDEVTVGPGQQAVLSDVVGQLAETGSAPIEVVAQGPVAVSSRTYTEETDGGGCVQGGTLGQGFSAFTVEQGLAAGEAAYLLMLREDAAARTNIDLTNAGDMPAEVVVTLRDGGGQDLAVLEVSLAPGQREQAVRPFFRQAGRDDLHSGYALVTVHSGGGVLASASVIDNLSNDASTQPALR